MAYRYNRWAPRIVPLVLPAALVAWVAAAGPSSCGRPGAPAQSLAQRQISRVIADYQAAYHHNDAAAMAELYAPDGFLLPPGRELIRGRAAIQKFWEQGMEAGFQMETLQVSAGMGTGYAVGRYYIPADAENDAETGKYVITFERQPDGVWRVAADIWNEDGTGSDDDGQQAPDSSFSTVAQALAALPRLAGR
ncbi:MAG TPA: SgcJ/EcaC family oxidoreductase [Gemmatimonadales bacterium]|nr:SgcJ/EcaC family oxidoreductase [Gemmatimonadales bacterium]